MLDSRTGTLDTRLRDTTLHSYVEILSQAAFRAQNPMEKLVRQAAHYWIDGPLLNAGRTNIVGRLKQMTTANDVTKLLGALFSIDHMATYLSTRAILYTSLYINLTIDCSGRIGEFVAGERQRTPKYLRWAQVRFYLFSGSNPNERNTIAAKISWTDLKGAIGSATKRAKSIPLRLLPLSLWTEDSLRQLLALAIIEKVLPQVTSWADIENLPASPDGVLLEMDATKSNHPVFRDVTRDHTVSDEPVTSSKMGSWLSRLGIRLGLEHKLISYCLRRGAAYLLAMKCSEEERCSRMGHQASDAVYWKYYRCETSTVDFQGLARDIDQEDVSRLTSITLNRRENAVKFLSASGFAQAVRDPEVIALSNAELEIMDRLLVVHGSIKRAREAQDPEYSLYIQTQKRTQAEREFARAKLFQQVSASSHCLGIQMLTLRSPTGIPRILCFRQRGS